MRPNQTTVMGVDPGSISAAYGIIPWDVEGGVESAMGFHMPVVNKMVDGKAFGYVLSLYSPAYAVVEKVNAMPKQGVTSSFRFVMGYGIIHGALAAKNVKIIEVAPGVWKRHFHLSADKEQARAL